jgi:hypothetical protein
MKPALHFASTRTVPRSILRQLREIDPRAELLYFGFGPHTDENGGTIYGPRWVLGIYDPTRPGRLQADGILHSQVSRDAGESEKMRFGRIVRAGFSPIQTYLQRDPDDAIVEDFRRADWLFRHDTGGIDGDGALFDQVADELEGGPSLRARMARVRDAVRANGIAAHRHASGRLVTSGSGRWSQIGRTPTPGASRRRSLFA